MVAGIGEDFEAQILVVVQAKAAGVRKVVARATTAVHQRVLEAVGADVVINPEREAAEAIVLRLLGPKGGKITQVAEGLCVVELTASGRGIGRTQRDHGADVLDQYGVRLIGLRRGSGPSRETLLDPNLRIEDGDVLFYAGSEESVVRLQGRG